MIKGLLLALAIVAVLWLALWTVRGERGKQGGWAPFDMRDPGNADAEASPPERSRRRPRARRAPPVRFSRRSR